MGGVTENESAIAEIRVDLEHVEALVREHLRRDNVALAWLTAQLRFAERNRGTYTDSRILAYRHALEILEQAWQGKAMPGLLRPLAADVLWARDLSPGELQELFGR